jgi:hypothetical protein
MHLAQPGSEATPMLELLVDVGARLGASAPVAELAQGLRPCHALVVALAYEIGGAHVEVERELVLDVVANLSAGAEREAEEPLHGIGLQASARAVVQAVAMTLWTAAA